MSVGSPWLSAAVIDVKSGIAIELQRFRMSADVVQFDLRDETLFFEFEAENHVPGFENWKRWLGSLDPEIANGQLLLLHHEEDGLWVGMFIVRNRLYRVLPLTSEDSTYGVLASDAKRQSNLLHNGSLLSVVTRALTEEPEDKTSALELCMVEKDTLAESAPDNCHLLDNRQPVHLDALVVYSQEALKALDRDPIWPSIANLSAEEHHRLLAQEMTNWSFTLAQLPITLQTTPYYLSDQQEADIEHAWDEGNTTSECFWSMLASGSSKVFHQLHKLRASRAADLVVFFEDNAQDMRLGASGKVCDRELEEINDAFALVDWREAVEQLVFTHEIGHVLGAGHSVDDTAISAYWRNYARGWCHIPQIAGDVGPWGTIMTRHRCQNATRLPYWSGQPPARERKKYNNACAILERARIAQDFMPQRHLKPATPADFCSENE